MDVDRISPLGTLDAIVEFIIKYQWVYDLQLTKYFVDKAWENIPSDWKDSLISLTREELNAFPQGIYKESWPESLKEFIQTSHTLSLPRSPQPGNVTGNELDKNMRKGMNPKKIHEVSEMAAVVDRLCKECDVQHIVDIGSGLGYLGQVLSGDYGYSVLGLEGVDSRVHGAEKQAMTKDLSNRAFRSVTFTLCDTDECFTQFHKMLQRELLQEECSQDKILADETGGPLQDQSLAPKEHEPEHCDTTQVTRSMPLCMMGLHCCADLTPTMLRLLTVSPDITCLVCVGCCYHNMTQTGTREYRCFPMSAHLRAVMSQAEEQHPEWRLNTFALRLAAQETRARWQRQTSEDHIYHMKNVAFRGIVELFCHREHSELTKLRRRVARKKDYDTFETYLAAVFDRTSLSENPDLASALDKLQHLYCSQKSYMVFIEPFTALQVTLQPVLESLIVLDRLQFLQEHNISATAIPIFNDEISPRNLALIGWKQLKVFTDSV